MIKEFIFGKIKHFKVIYNTCDDYIIAVSTNGEVWAERHNDDSGDYCKWAKVGDLRKSKDELISVTGVIEILEGIHIVVNIHKRDKFGVGGDFLRNETISIGDCIDTWRTILQKSHRHFGEYNRDGGLYVSGFSAFSDIQGKRKEWEELNKVDKQEVKNEN